MVELLNSGIWVFDKQGNVQSNYPKSLPSFWSANSLRNSTCLTDTQIAYEPIAQKWIATTLCDTNTDGDLYVAISNTSDATGTWTAYNFQSVCSKTEPTTPVPDQPVLGYNQNWVAIDVLCGVPGGSFGSDQIVLIPHSTLTQNPLPQTLPATLPSPVPFFGARPSRDVSGIASQNLFLVGSVIPAGTSFPFVQVTAIDANGKFAPPGPSNVNSGIVNSPGNGVLGTGSKAAQLAQHDNCGSGANCDVDLGDARLTSVILQTGNDGKHYLLTSFHAGDRANNTTQALWFMGQTDTFATTSQWNGWYVDGPGFWAAYPTITMDNDLDAAFTFQTFYLNSNIYPNWYIAKGFILNNNSFALAPPLLGYGILDNPSRSSYYGNTKCSPPGSPPQRWGDYMSTIWDPSLGSPNEGSGFWTVQEYSNGGPTPTALPTPTGGATPLGSNQSTQITMLADPLPFFVGYNVPNGTDGTTAENECPSGTGFNCNLKYLAPPNSQFGDLFVATIQIGEATDANHLTVPTGWTILKNEGGNRSLASSDGTFNLTSFVALYVYGSQPNDTGEYKLKIAPQSNGAEVTGFLVAYRGASTSIPGNYKLYGNPGTGDFSGIQTKTLSPNNSDSPAGETTLLNLFNQGCIYTPPEDPDFFIAFGPPSGSPAVTVETPLNSTSGFFAADVAVPTSGGTYGAYKSVLGCSSLSHAYSLVIPE